MNRYAALHVRKALHMISVRIICTCRDVRYTHFLVDVTGGHHLPGDLQ